MLTSIRTLAQVILIGMAVAFGGSVASAQIGIANTSNLPDDLFDGANDPLHVNVGGNDFLFAVASNDFGIMGFSIASNGMLTLVSETRQTNAVSLSQPYALASAVVGGTTYLFVASRTDDTIHVFSVSDAGALTFVSSASDDGTVNLDLVTDIATAEVAGTTYVIAAGASDDGISVFSVAANGTLTNVDNVNDSGSLALRGTWGLATAEVGGTDYVFVSGVFDSGVSVFSIAANGTLTNTDNVTDSGSLELSQPWEVTTAVVDGTTYLVVSGYSDDGISVFSVASNGTLTNVHNVADNGTLFLDGVQETSAIEIDGTVFLYATGALDGGVSVFSIASNGTLANVANVPDTDSTAFGRPGGIDTAMIDGSPFVFVTGESDDGISTFAAATDGTLSHVQAVFDSQNIALDRVYGLTIAQVGGNDYLFSAADNDNAVAAMSIGANGALTQVARVVDDGTVNLDGVRGVATAAIGATTYLFAAGFDDDGVSVFSVAANGALTNVFNIADSGSLELLGARALATANVGGTDLLFVGGDTDAGISVFSIAANGSLASASDFPDDGTTSFDSPHSISTAVVDGTTYLFVGGSSLYSGGISVFSVASNGVLTNVDNVSDSGSLELSGDVSTTTAVVSGTTYLFASGRNDSGVSVFSVAANGSLTNVANVADSGSRLLATSSGVSTFVHDSTTYLVVTGEGDDGFSVFSVAANGSLTSVADVADDNTNLLNNVHAVTSGTVGGSPYIFTGAWVDDGISTFTVDSTAPLVASIDRQTPSTSPTSADSVTWRVTFNEQVTNVDAADFTRTGTTGTLSVSSATSTAWDVTLSGGDMASLNATVTLGFAGGQNITDLAGNTLSNTTPTGTNTNTFVLSNDITAPRIASIVRNNPTSSTTAADVLVWRVTFDEAVQNVTTGDFTITGTTATIFDVTNNSATESDVVVRGGDLNDLNATVTLGIAGGQDITDLAGNALSNTTPTGTTQLTYQIDNTPPVFTAISRNAPATSPTNADTLVFDLTFSESVAGVGAEDFTITGTTATGVLGGAGSSYTLTLSGGDLDNLDGTVSIAMVASPFIFDLAGNLMVGSTPTVTNVNSYVVQNSSPPVFSLVFSPDTINDGQVTTATYTINSTANPVSATGLDFTHNLPAGIHVAGANASTTCTGGTLPNVVGSSAVTYTGGSVGAGATCTVSMDIVSISPGTYATTTGDLTSSLGNSGTASDTLTVLDITAPRIASIARQSPTSSATNGSSVTWRVTFDEAVQNVTADDFTRTGTTGTLAVNNVSSTVTDVTVSGGDMASVNDTVELGFAGGQDIADTAGNALSNTTPTGTNDNTFLVDHAPPSVIISGPSGPVSGAFSVTFTFSEAMTGVAVGDITVGSGAASNLQQSDSVTYSATITPAGEGSVTVNFAAGAATDSAGNDNVAASPFSVTADTTAPRLSHFSGIQTYTHLDTISFRATFNEDVANVSATDFSVSGTTATVTNVTAIDDTTYTLTVSGGDLADIANTTVSLAIAGGHDIADVAGNLLTNTTAIGSNDSIYVNNTPPVGIFTSGSSSPVSGDFTVNLDFTPQAGFADNILGLTQSDIVISNATIESFTHKFSGVTTGATLVVRPTSSGTVTLDLPANSVIDEAENANPASTQFSITADLTAPRLATIARRTPLDERTNDDTLAWNVTFDESVINVDAADFVLSGSTATLSIAEVGLGDQPDVVGPAARAPIAASTWRVTASGGDLADLNAAVSLALAASPTINDQAGNALTDTSATGTVETFDVRNLAPLIATIERTMPATSATNEDSLTWRFTFAQIDNSFSLPANAFTVSGTTGTVTNVSRFSTGFDVTVSGGDLASLDGDVTIGLANTDFADDYGNVMDRTIPGGAELTYTVDNTAPSGHAVSINPSPINAANQTAIGVDFTGFEAGGSLTYTVTSSGGAGSLSGGFAVPVADGSFPPQDTSVIPDGTTTLTVIHTDAVGNAAPAITVTALKDTVVPTLAITGPSGSVSGAFTATFTFSEDIQNFDLSDITVGNGAASNLQTVSASDDGMSGPAVVAAMRVFAATITPASDGAVTVDVAGSAAQDDAGNANTAATQFSVTNDATAPVATNVEFVTTGGTPTASDTLMWAVTFSEDVTNVSANDFALTGTTGTVTTVDTPQPNVVVVTASGGDLANLDGQVTLTLAGGSDLSDAAGNTPADLTVQSGGTDQRTVYLDNTAPTLTSVVHHRPLTSPTDSDTLTWRVSFSESVNGVDAGDFTISGTTATLSISTPSAGPDVPAAATTAQSTNNTFDVTASGGNLANLNGEVTLTLVTTGGIADNSGNGFTNASPTGTDERTWSVLNDAVAPRVASIARLNPLGGNTSADSLTWRVTFSEPVGNIDTSDFAVTGSTAQAVQVSPIALGMPPQVTGDGPGQIFAVSQSTYDVTISGGDLSTLTAVVSLGFAPTQDISDDAGNALVDTGPTGTNQAYFVDNESPTATISTTASSPISGPFQVTILFSENVAGFEGADLSVTNATLSDISASSASVYTATVKPGTGASVTLQMTANGVEDAAGNPNAASEVFSIVHDTNRTLTVSLPGVGEGTVTSLPAGIDCGTDCSEEIAVGTNVTLTATAASGSSFAGWTDGPCTGSGNTACAFVMSVDQSVAARFTLETPPAGRIVAATLPGARSGHVGGPVVTAFLSVVSRTTSPAQSCTIAAPAGAPVTLSYSRLDGAGEVTGPVDPVFDIAAGDALSFVIAMTPVSETPAAGYDFLPVINCENASLDPIVGVNSVHLTIGSAPSPDILSISATPSGDGVIRIPASGRVQLMTAAAVNIGVGDGSAGANEVTLTTSVDTGAAVLPVSLEVCQINAAAACITPRGPTTTTVVGQNEPAFFAVFVRDTSGGSGIAFDPANSRVFLRFSDASGVMRSSTSAAVLAPPAADAPETAAIPMGRWSVLRRQPEGIWPGLARTDVYVLPSGQVIIDDGQSPRLNTMAAGETGPTFSMANLDGHWQSDGAIRLGQMWSDSPGEFWGVRDARSDMAGHVAAVTGQFGDPATGDYVTIGAGGQISGRIGACLVSGTSSAPVPGASGLQTASLTLMSCARSGLYQAVVDAPANDADSAVLVIAGTDGGWRIAQ